jgi:predicted ATPase/DNA-binding XRE family transcriptional regulator
VRAKSVAMPGKSAFSELLKQHRRAAGYSQEALAERSGLSARAIAALEQGSRRAPYRDTVKALGDALGLSQNECAQLEEVAASARGRPRQEASSIPAPLTSFIERAEVGTILELLLEHRFLTVTGSGGVGKTRVAVEVARRFEERFDQTWFIDLLPIRDRSMLAPYIAARLNISVSGGDALSTIVRELRSRRAFLVLDNCEHLVAETATVLATLVRDCRQLTVLVTSREALGLVAESVFHLPPMNIEGATELFVARARTQDRSLFFDSERLEIAAGICKELDRIPLAIELAASRLPALGFAELRKRLKSGTTLAGSRDLPVHHQTIVDTIRWSYDLLADVDRLVFERLSVFIGGFTLAAAEAICADESVPATAIGDIVPRLVRKSLIDAELIGTSTRYRFLETIRSFAWERLLQRGDVASTMLRLVEWLRDEALRLGTWYQSPEAVTALRQELDNLVTSASWTISTGDAATMVAAAYALMNFSNAVFGTRRHEEIRQLIFGLLDRLRDSEHPEAIGLLICRTATFLTFEEVPQLAARAIPLLISTGHRPEAATLHSRAAHSEIELGNGQAAEEHLSAGGLLLTQEERTQSNYGIHFSVECSYVRSVLADFTGARAALADLVIPPGYLQPRIVFAEIEFREGHFQKALQLLEEPKRGLAAYPPGHPLRIMIFGNAAKYALLLGDARTAEIDLRQALADVLDTSDHAQMFSSVFVQAASYAAVFAAKGGRLELAARLLGACEASSNPSNLDVDRHPDELAAPLLTSLSPEQAKALRDLGAREDLYDLIEEFLAD